jgi:hypothetical protein
MRITHRHRAIAAALLVAAGAALFATCSGALRRPLSGNGAVLWRIGETPNPPVTNVRGRDGDLALMSASVAVVVAGEAENPRRAHRVGSIVGAMTAAAEGGELEELRPVVRTSAAEVPLDVVKIKTLKRDGAPLIEIRARNEALDLEVTTRVALDPGAPRVRIETTIANDGDATLAGVQLGDRVVWPDGLTFAPGSGYASAPAKAEAPWIGRRGVEASYALAFPDKRMMIEFEFEPHGPMGALALSQPAPLPPGASRTYRRSLVVAKGGLERAAREAWTALGAKLARVSGTLSPTPAWASIEVRGGGDRPVIIGDAAQDGTFEVWAPAGRYAIVARAPGGEDRVDVDAAAGMAVEIAFTPPTPGVMRFHVTDADGRPIPSRLVLRGVPPTWDPHLGPRHLARGAENVVYTASGDGAVELPVGRYLVTATHGVEYSIASQEISVTEGTGAVVRAELRHEFETPGWIAAELHLHAEPSYDSSVSLRDRVTSLLTEDLDFSAATDHNIVTDYAPTISELSASDRLGSARGVEVTTEDPQLGHFNVWPYPEGAAIPPFAGQTPRSLFAAIRAAAPGAILQVNHPRMNEYNIGYFGIVGLDPETGAAKDRDYSADFDAVEVWNGMNNDHMEVTRQNVAEWFALLNAGHRYTATGGSDSHVLVYQWAGFPRDYVRVAGAGGKAPDAEAVAAAVRAGRVQVGAGPFIALEVAGGEPGDLVSAKEGRALIEVEVHAASWVDVDAVEVWVNGELEAEGALAAAGAGGASRGRLSLRLPLERDSFVVAIARGDKPMTEVLPYTKLAPYAVTNPVFVDVDGDGAFTPLGMSAGGHGGRDAGASASAQEDAGHAN